MVARLVGKIGPPREVHLHPPADRQEALEHHMHPGNIFVAADEPQRPRYLAVDFGIMGSLSPADQHYLAENFPGALAVFAVSTLSLQAQRRRRLPDVTLWCWRLGMLSLLGAVAAWLTARFFSASPALALAAGVLYIVGFLQSVVTEMLYKILPFLVWLHTRELRTGVSNMRQVLAERPMRGQSWCHGAALSALLLACWFPWASRAAGLLYALSCGWLGANLWLAVHVYRRALRQSAETRSGLQ